LGQGRTQSCAEALMEPSAFWSLGFFAKDLVNHFSELTFGNRLLNFRAGDFLFQIQHEPLQPVATGLELFDLDFQMPDFGSQVGRDFLFIHNSSFQFQVFNSEASG
jgi:hypothetical protein